MLCTPHPLKDKDHFAKFNLPDDVTRLADSILEYLPVHGARYFIAHMEHEIKTGNDMSFYHQEFAGSVRWLAAEVSLIFFDGPTPCSDGWAAALAVTNIEGIYEAVRR
jgi:hypothetical protein